MATLSEISWTDPVTNTDGTPILPGEITGFEVGVRPASGTAGTYSIHATVADTPALTTSVLLSALDTVLSPGDYEASVRALTGAVDASGVPVTSAWASEVSFTVDALVPIPNAPTSVSVS